jgi:hypothetical protein
LLDKPANHPNREHAKEMLKLAKAMSEDETVPLAHQAMLKDPLAYLQRYRLDPGALFIDYVETLRTRPRLILQKRISAFYSRRPFPSCERFQELIGLAHRIVVVAIAATASAAAPTAATTIVTVSATTMARIFLVLILVLWTSIALSATGIADATTQAIGQSFGNPLIQSAPDLVAIAYRERRYRPLEMRTSEFFPDSFWQKTEPAAVTPISAHQLRFIPNLLTRVLPRHLHDVRPELSYREIPARGQK